MNILFDLFWNFAYIGILSFGNAMSMIPEIERLITIHGWMDHQTYAEIYAMGQLVPGSNMLHIILIGNKVAGLPGAVAAGLGMFGPTSLIVYIVARILHFSTYPAWFKQLYSGLNPITIGLLMTIAWKLGQGTFNNIFLVIVCGVTVLLTVKQVVSSSGIVLLAALIGALKTWLFFH